MHMNADACIRMHMNAYGKKLHHFWEKTTPHPGTSVTSFQEPARAIQIPDSTPRPGFWRTGQFPRTGAGHPESRFRVSPRILEPGQISTIQDPDIAMQNPTYAPRALRYLEIERQNTDSKFRDSSFCLRSCTHASSNLAPMRPDRGYLGFE